MAFTHTELIGLSPDSESESKGSGNSKGGDFGDSKLKDAQVSIFYLLLV